jgi:hypothetical protein
VGTSKQEIISIRELIPSFKQASEPHRVHRKRKRKLKIKKIKKNINIPWFLGSTRGQHCMRSCNYFVPLLTLML